MNKPKYYYTIQALLQKLPQNEAKATIKLLEKELGKNRVVKHRYYKPDAKSHVIMRVEEALIYQEVFELENVNQILSSYTSKYGPSKFFEKVGVAKR